MVSKKNKVIGTDYILELSMLHSKSALDISNFNKILISDIAPHNFGLDQSLFDN